MRSIEINCMGCLAPLKWVFSNLTFATLCFAHTGHFLQWWEMSFFIPTQKYRCLIDAYVLGNPLCPLWSCAVTRTWSMRHLGITMGWNSLPVDSTILCLRIPSSIRYTFASQITYLESVCEMNNSSILCLQSFESFRFQRKCQVNIL